MLALDLDKDEDTPVIVRRKVCVALGPGQAGAPNDSGPVAVVERGPETRRGVAVWVVDVADRPQRLVVHGAVAVVGARVGVREPRAGRCYASFTRVFGKNCKYTGIYLQHVTWTVRMFSAPSRPAR